MWQLQVRNLTWKSLTIEVVIPLILVAIACIAVIVYIRIKRPELFEKFTPKFGSKAAVYKQESTEAGISQHVCSVLL
jgi:uncharacterized membrane protein YqiK